MYAATKQGSTHANGSGGAVRKVTVPELRARKGAPPSRW